MVEATHLLLYFTKKTKDENILECLGQKEYLSTFMNSMVAYMTSDV
jgi:hypothetical protein